MKKFLSFGAGAALVLAAQSSFAGSMSTTPLTLDYILTLTGACTAATVTAGPIDLGTYATDQPALTGVTAGTIAVECPAPTLYGVMVDAGSSPDATPATKRRLLGTGTGTLIPYDLRYGVALVGDNDSSTYSTATYSVTMNQPGIPANIAGGWQSYALTADINIPASIPSPTIDDYTDSVAVTVVW